MTAIAIGQSSSCAAPVLDLWTQVSGILVNVFELKYQIFNVIDPDTPVQVFPVTLGEKATVLVDIDCPAGDRLSTGHYVARWTVPGGTTTGTYLVRWFIKLTGSSAEQLFSEEFEILPEVVAFGTAPGYCLVSELRSEGVTTAMASDSKLQSRIYLASRMIDKITGQWFEPRTRTVIQDGRGNGVLRFSVPIIAIGAVSAGGLVVDASTYKVYNRHLAGVISPDDRQDPRIVRFEGSSNPFYSSPTWAAGVQNIEITGVFGYTDAPDDLSTPSQGITPVLINRACRLMVIRDLADLANTAARLDAQQRGRLISETTRDQSYTLAAKGASSSGAIALTGDDEIDLILQEFLAPIAIGST